MQSRSGKQRIDVDLSAGMHKETEVAAASTNCMSFPAAAATATKNRDYFVDTPHPLRSKEEEAECQRLFSHYLQQRKYSGVQ